MTATAAAPASGVIDDPLELAAFTRWQDGPSAEVNATSVGDSAFVLGGITCAACALVIERALLEQPGVLSAHVHAAARTARVRWRAGTTRASDLIEAVRRAGYSAAPDTAAAAREQRRNERRSALWRVSVATLCAMQVMMLATPSYVSAPGELAPDLRRLLEWGQWLLSLPVLCFCASPFFSGAWRAVRERHVGMDVPVALGILVSFAASSVAAFRTGGTVGAAVYFDSLTMFVAFVLAGRTLEMTIRHRAIETLERELGEMPVAAYRVLDNGAVETISARRVVVGDLLRVPVGDAFVADGAIRRGPTDVDESVLTGESCLVSKRVGDAVAAGAINRSAPTEFRVERVGPDTRLESVRALMREAASQRPSLARTADRWAAPFLWSIMVLAAGAGIGWYFVDPTRAIWVAVSVLVVTCPCALSLAVPSALLCATSALARRGVLVRRLEALEALARVRTLFIDKTGTLTGATTCEARISVLSADERSDEASLRATAASLAAWSHHPLARALARGHASGAESEAGWRAIREEPGAGLEAVDRGGRTWRLGSAAWAGGADTPPAEAGVWLGSAGVALARFDFVEELRPDAGAAIEGLKRSGIAVELLSGDQPARVAGLAKRLGIERYRGGLSPEGKCEAVRAAQARREIVAMVGDGINDAPVLASADVSLAIGQGTALARSQADAVLTSDSLLAILTVCSVSRRAMRIVRQNLVWAGLYNAVCVPLAVVGWLPPWAAGLGMASSSLLVVANSARLAR